MFQSFETTFVLDVMVIAQKDKKRGVVQRRWILEEIDGFTVKFYNSDSYMYNIHI